MLLNHVSHEIEFSHPGMLPSFNFGQEAVILFFLVSGFVITYSFLSKTNRSFGRFLFDRITRIYVPLVPAITLAWLVASYQDGQFRSIDIGTLAGNLFMLQDIPSLKPGVIARPWMDNSPLWSLSYEWWFYMLFFLSFIAQDSWRHRTFTVIAVGILAAAAYPFYPHWVLRVLFYLPLWWLGAVFALQHLGHDEARGFVKATIVGIFPIIAILTIGAWGQIAGGETRGLGVHPLLEIRHLSSGLVLTLFALVWRRIGWIGYGLLLRPFALIAPISYAIYIVHKPLLGLVRPLSTEIGFAASCGLALTAIVVISWGLEIWLFPRVKAALLQRW